MENISRAFVLATVVAKPHLKDSILRAIDSGLTWSEIEAIIRIAFLRPERGGPLKRSLAQDPQSC